MAETGVRIPVAVLHKSPANRGEVCSGVMTQGDRQIPDKDRCQTCKGAGWTWWLPEGESEGRWIVCRDCIGTGRVDQKGRKRQKPDSQP
jgi:DnaJ-class molecular chaperone